MWRVKFLIIGLAMLGILTGCAEQVSGAKPKAGNILRFTVNFREPFQAGDYKYVFVFSKQAIQAPMNYFLFTPGDATVLNNQSPAAELVETVGLTVDAKIAYYYKHYFSSWTDSFLLQSGQSPQISRSNSTAYPVSANQTIHTGTYALGNVSNQFSMVTHNTGFYLDIPMSDFSAVPVAMETFYFDFLVIDRADTLVDRLDSDKAILTNQINTQTLDSFDDVLIISGNLDITDWKAEIL